MPNPYFLIRYGTKTVQAIKLSVRAPEPSYSERDMGVARHRWRGVCVMSAENVLELDRVDILV